MKTSSWFDAVALLVMSLISVTVGVATDTDRTGPARAVVMERR
jgi:hypothetical protein